MRVPLVWLTLAAACTTVQYDGPRLPRGEVARVAGDGTEIHQMDDDRVAASYVEVLPGEHQMEVALDQPLPGGAVFRSAHDQTVCFTAYAGRLYHVRAAASVPYVPNHWRPAVFDYKAEVFVDHPCPVRKHQPLVLPSPPPATSGDQKTPPGPPVPQAADPE
jgi:hypothetical protein